MSGVVEESADEGQVFGQFAVRAPFQVDAEELVYLLGINRSV